MRRRFRMKINNSVISGCFSVQFYLFLTEPTQLESLLNTFLVSFGYESISVDAILS